MTISSNRIEAFSDGVIAIIITIMVFDLKVSASASALELWTQLTGALLPKLLWYTLSFLMLAIMWVNHHFLFHDIQKSDAGLVWLNMHLLFWMSLVPFVTNLVGENTWLYPSVLLYAFVFLMNAVAFTLIRKHGIKAKLFHAHVTETRHLKAAKRNRFAISLYAIAGLSSLLNVYLSFALLILVPGMYLFQTFNIKQNTT